MVTLEQKVDLLMRYAAATYPEESNRLHEEIRKIVSDSDATAESTTSISSFEKDALMTNIIDDLFRDLGAPSHLVGYDQAAYAIKLVIYDDEYIRMITKRLYPEVAKKFNTTPSRTERAIRHLVETTWARSDFKTLNGIFGNSVDANKGKSINSHFIATCARIVKRRMREHGVNV